MIDGPTHSLILFGLFFLLLYLFSFIFNSVNFEQCSQGYISGGACSQQELLDHLFSASDNMDFSDDSVGPYGYTIDGYIIPSGEDGAVIVYGASDSDVFIDQGVLPGYSYRHPVIWSDIQYDQDFEYMHGKGLGFYIGGTPHVENNFSYSSNTPNEMQYKAQQHVLLGTTNTDFPYCPLYAPYSTFGDTNWDESEYSTIFGQNFSDASFACSECRSSSKPHDYFFDGTLWVSESERTYKIDPKPNNFQYTYGYLNFVSSELDEYANYLNEVYCPNGIGAVMKNVMYSYFTQTTVAMAYLNTLSNSVLDPQLNEFVIQAAYSQYGSLFFDAQLISLFASFLLTMFSVLILNVLWPLSVWRLAYERGADISLMMRTVGMRASTYIGGMFLFDMILSIGIGALVLGTAKGIGMFQYNDAPIGYLLAIVFLSSYALNAFSLVAVRLSPKNAGIISLVAACLAMGSAVTCGLLSQLQYPKVCFPMTSYII